MTRPLHIFCGLLFSFFVATMLISCEQKENEYTIGVLQWTENIQPFNKTYTGILDRLNDMGYLSGINLNLKYINVDQNQKRAAAAAQNFVEQDVDLILALGTGSSIAALKATQKQRIPIVFSIAGAPKATGIIDSFEDSGRNITGVSMRIPAVEQFQIISEVLPKITRLGILYCSEMIQAIATGEEAAKASFEFGWTQETMIILKSELDQLEVKTAELAQQVDAIYIPTDPILGIPENMGRILAIADDHGIPVIGGAQKFVESGALAAVHCDFYQMGRQTAELIIQIFRGVPIQKIRPQKAIVKRVSLNLNKAQQLQVAINRNSILKADFIVD